LRQATRILRSFLQKCWMQLVFFLPST
jgi:hypothetical protein